jgi:peptidoglycan hydrolase FlgJ
VDPVTGTATSAAITRAATAAGMTPADQRKLRTAANEVESLFLGNLLKMMRQASSQGSAPLTGQGQRIYQEMMDEQLGRALANSGGLGLSDMLVRDVIRRQASAKKPSSDPVDVPKGRAGGDP